MNLFKGIFFLFICLCLLGNSTLKAQKPEIRLKAHLLRSFNGHKNSKVEYVGFDYSGKKIITCGHDHLMHLIDIDDPIYIKIFKGHNATVNDAAFNRSGTLLASASDDGTVKVWDIASQTVLYSFATAVPSAMYKEAYFVVFSPDERYLYFGGRNMSIKRVALSQGAVPESIYAGTDYITCAKISPDKRYLAFGKGYGVYLLDLESNKISGQMDGTGDYVNDLLFSQDGSLLGAWCQNGTLRLWEYPSGKSLGTIIASKEKGYCQIAISSNKKWLATGSEKKSFKIWDLQERRVVWFNEEHQADVRAMQFSPTQPDLLITGSYDGTVRLWRLTEEVIAVVPPPPSATKPTEQLPIPPTPPIPVPPQANIKFDAKNLPKTINDRQINLKASIPVRNLNLILEVYDDEQEDGDVITLFLNETKILDNHRLTLQRKEIPITISPTEPNVLILYAINMGKKPPATVAIRINDGVVPQMINLAGDPKQTQAFKLIYREKK